MLGKAFVDCSGDADLAFHCGASTRYGNHGAVNLGSLATRFGGLPWNVAPTARLWQEAILLAKSKNPGLQKLLRKNQSVLIRLPMSGDIVAFLASASYDARSASSITAAEISGRRQSQAYLEILRKLPGHENMYLVSTGPNFGTRESRHVNAMYQLTEDDIISNRHFHDNVALGAWGIEFHDAEHCDWESSFKIPPNGPFRDPTPVTSVCRHTKSLCGWSVRGWGSRGRKRDSSHGNCSGDRPGRRSRCCVCGFHGRRW